MKKARKLSNKIVAVLLSMAMTIAPVLENSVVAFAAEADAKPANVGTLSDAAQELNSTTDGVESADVTSGDLIAEGETTENSVEASLATASEFSSVGGWNESIYAEIAGISDSDVTAVSWSGTATGSLTGEDLEYLVRSNGNGGVRIDIPGLKAGTYTLSVTVGGNTITKEGITVSAYDRSGFAHFNYTRGVGAYKDDGTLKDKAIVLYVTDKNKNDVTLSYGGKTVTGIGNILNSVGQESGGTGLASNGGAANTNQGIIKDLASAGIPLVVRFIGTVSDSGLYSQGSFNASSACLIKGLTAYSSVDQGGTKGDNGHMARIQSGKDITLEGIGYDATIDGWGFHFICQSSNPELGESFEVRNLTFINTPEDAVGMEGQQASKNASAQITASVERCWIHHNEYYKPTISSPAESDKAEGDGSVDFKRGQYFTCSYNYFEGCHKTNLVGSADYSLQFNLSYHHNWWYMCKARGPLARRANIHMYNNIWDMQTDYAENTRADAYTFSEYNLFYACKSPQAVEAGAIKSFNDSISSVIWNKGSAGTVVANKTDTVANNCKYSYGNVDYSKFDTTASQSYIPGNNYTLQTDFIELRKVIATETGVMNQNPGTASRESSVIVKSGATVKEIDLSTLGADGYTTLPGKAGKVSKATFAFYVNGAFDITVEYADAAKAGVLVNEAGENLLEGSGSAVNLKEGTYMIQPINFQPGTYANSSSFVTWKEFTISGLTIKAHDSKAHYHKWVLDSAQSKAATCTAAGENVYVCQNTDTACTVDGGKKTEVVAALGHSWGAWTVTKEATETEDGVKSRTCTRCGETETAAIPKGSSGTGGGESGGTGGGSTAAGDYAITFDASKKAAVGDTDFFTVNGNYSNSKGTATVNETTYTDSLKMEKATTISFECNDGATLFLAFASTETNKKVKIDGVEKKTDSSATVTVEALSAGTHTITKGDSINLFYVSLANGVSNETYYTLSFDYNYDDAPDAKTVTVIAGKIYTSEEELLPAGFARSGYLLKGLYTDTDCTTKVAYPYTVTGNATLYADWEVNNTPVEKTYSLIFETNGGSTIPTVEIGEAEVYVITQRPTKTNYAFAGWYDALTDGNPVEKVDGSTLTGSKTVYAYWNEVEKTSLSLDCSKDIVAANITEGGLSTSGSDTIIAEKTTVKGFTIHALAGEKTTGSSTIKYYMVVKDGGLGTNGVLISSANANSPASGNEDGLLKAIEFKAPEDSVLTVDVSMNGDVTKAGTYDLVLAQKDSAGTLQVVERKTLATYTSSTIKKDSTRGVREFTIPAEGTYYLYPEDTKGVTYYSLQVGSTDYTILYQIGNGTAPEGLVNGMKKVGETVTLKPCTPDAGFTFKGWSLDGGMTVLEGSNNTEGYTYTVDEEDAVSGTITLTAVYDATAYTLKYNAGEGTLPEGLTDQTVSAGQKLTLGVCTPKTDSYKFTGWTIGDSNKKYISSYTVSAADADAEGVITLKAAYEEIVLYKVTFDANGGNLPAGLTEKSVEAGTIIELTACTPAEGKRFVGWSIGEGDSAKTYADSYVVNAADADENKTITLKAEYTAASNYVVKLDANDGTLPDGLDETTPAAAGETVTLGACTPAAGKKFTGWSIGEGDNKKTYTDSYTVSAADADAEGVITLTAEYEAIQYTLKFNANGGTLPEGLPEKAVAGTALTLGACTPATGKKFAGWSVGEGDNKKTYPTSYTVSAADADTEDVITLTAEYTDVVTHTVKFDSQGGLTVLDQSVEDGQKAVKPEDPKKDKNTFEGWFTDEEFTEAYDFDTPVTKDITLYAKWKEDASVVLVTYTVKFDSKGGSAVSQAVVEENAKCARPADPTREGYAFENWYTDENLTTVYDFNAAVTADITLYAKWTQNASSGTIGGDDQNTHNGNDENSHGGNDESGLHIVLVDSEDEFYYTGLAIKPEIEVWNDGVLLTEGTDYTVKYANNVKASIKKKASITVTGKGNLTGKATKEFTIQPRSLEEVTIDEAVYVVSGSKANPILVYNGIKLTAKDYTISDPKKTYTADDTVTIKGQGNFGGQLENWPVKVIQKTDLKKFKVTVSNVTEDNKQLVYTGEPVRPKVTVTGDSGELDEALYTIAWPEDTVNAGTVKFTVIGFGFYTGTMTKSYKIKPLAGTGKAELDTKDFSYTPNGVVVNKHLTVSVDDHELAEGKDYTVSHSNNKKVGEGKYTVKFIGNYKGTKPVSGTFTIGKASLNALAQDLALKVLTVDKTAKKAGAYKSVPYVSIDNTAVKGSELTIKYYTDSDRKTEMGKGASVSPAADAPATVYVRIWGKGTNLAYAEDDYIDVEYNVWLTPSDKTKDLSKAKIVAKDGSKLAKQEYTGEELEPEIAVKIGSATLSGDALEAVCDVEYINNVNKGKATVIITAKDGSGYAGGKAMNFSIVSKNLKNIPASELFENFKRALGL